MRSGLGKLSSFSPSISFGTGNTTSSVNSTIPDDQQNKEKKIFASTLENIGFSMKKMRSIANDNDASEENSNDKGAVYKQRFFKSFC